MHNFYLQGKKIYFYIQGNFARQKWTNLKPGEKIFILTYLYYYILYLFYKVTTFWNLKQVKLFPSEKRVKITMYNK